MIVPASAANLGEPWIVVLGWRMMIDRDLRRVVNVSADGFQPNEMVEMFVNFESEIRRCLFVDGPLDRIEVMNHVGPVADDARQFGPVAFVDRSSLNPTLPELPDQFKATGPLKRIN